jgi:hypothetical protein
MGRLCPTSRGLSPRHLAPTWRNAWPHLWYCRCTSPNLSGQGREHGTRSVGTRSASDRQDDASVSTGYPTDVSGPGRGGWVSRRTAVAARGRAASLPDLRGTVAPHGRVARLPDVSDGAVCRRRAQTPRDRAPMRTEAFLRTVQEKVGRIDRKTAERATAAVFHALRDRLTPVEADWLATQLSGPLRLSPGWTDPTSPRRSSPSSRRSVVWSGPRESNGRHAGESSC